MCAPLLGQLLFQVKESGQESREERRAPALLLAAWKTHISVERGEKVLFQQTGAAQLVTSDSPELSVLQDGEFRAPPKPGGAPGAAAGLAARQESVGCWWKPLVCQQTSAQKGSVAFSRRTVLTTETHSSWWPCLTYSMG